MFMEYVEKWFDNIGEKIKRYAKLLFAVELIIGIAASCIMMVVGFMVTISEDVLGGFGVMGIAALNLLLAPVAAWLSCFVLYALGELVEKTTQNERNTAMILKHLIKDETAEQEREEHQTATDCFIKNVNADNNKKAFAEGSVPKKSANTIVPKYESIDNETLCDMLKYTLSFVSDETVKFKMDSLCQNEKYAIYFEHLKDVPADEIREEIKKTLAAWGQ